VNHHQPFWSVPHEALLQELSSTSQGLSSQEAENRLQRYGANLLKPKKKLTTFSLLISQYQSPIILILIFAAGLSFYLRDHTDATIILVIVLVSGLLGFWQEKGAVSAVEKLLAIVHIKASALRDGNRVEIPVEEIVPGDILVFAAGDVIPADCLILEAKDLFVDEAALTGETYPIEKSAGVLPAKTPLGSRTNSLFMGTHIVSGSAKAVAVHTGRDTEFGRVSERLKLRPPETEFERGIRGFGYFLMEVTLMLVIAIFAINVYFKKPVLDSFLFSLALAVGLTPQLLPAIISINLASGAKRMAAKKVIVKRLASIENFGSMNVLCSDKTGTLTEGAVEVKSALDIDGDECEPVFLYAYINACHETGFTNPLDAAIRNHRNIDISAWQKLDEVPYDFIRKRLSILVAKEGQSLIITKGALKNVLAVCAKVEVPRGSVVGIDEIKEKILSRYENLSTQGFRILGVAYRDLGSGKIITKDSEQDMTFFGFIVFYDPLKPDIIATINQLKNQGVNLKIITGDNRLVSAAVYHQLGFPNPSIITGQDLHNMSDEALLQQVNKADVFAEVEPNHKERIILALKKSGNVVGFLGDGINDASALHSSDVGISVNSAVDVAKEAADIVLLEKGLDVLEQGIQEGRKTFANTLKYVFMATSANFGNMFSMAGASSFLPFLPLLPKQIILTNLLTDLPEMTISTDSVDQELVQRPRKWDIGFIRRFMMVFGLLSSVFDFLTFGALLFILHANQTQFRTAWFIESVISASTIVLVVRTRKPFYRSLPGRYLMIATLIVAIVTAVMPYTPLARILGFDFLAGKFWVFIAIIVALYVIAAEFTKKIFYRLARL